MVALIRRSPEGTLAVGSFLGPMSLMDEIEEMASIAFDTGLSPKLDLYEENNELVVKADFPGVEKKNLDISLEDDVLTIKAEKKQEKTTEEATYYACERSFGQYSRSISLPSHVDADKVSATFKKGVLEIRMPSAEEPERKQIEIKVK